MKFYKDYMIQENQLKKTFEIWNQIEVDRTTVNDFVSQALEIPTENVSTVKKNQQANLFHTIQTEMAAMGSSQYALFNGFTHYTTHVVKSSKMFGNAVLLFTWSRTMEVYHPSKCLRSQEREMIVAKAVLRYTS